MSTSKDKQPKKQKTLPVELPPAKPPLKMAKSMLVPLQRGKLSD